MKNSGLKPLSFFFVFVLLLSSAPSFAQGITVRVPGTDIVGVLGVDNYEIYIGEYYRRGCVMEASFVRIAGNDSIADKNLRWLQLVSTNEPLFTEDPAQYFEMIDGFYDPFFHEPFYWRRSGLIWVRNDSELFFLDMPSSTYWHDGWDFEWYDGWDIDTKFELYLVRQLDKAIQPLARITWGYRVDTSGVVVLHDARLQNQGVPSRALEQALAEEFPGWSFAGASHGYGGPELNGDDLGDGDGGGGGCLIHTLSVGLWQ